MTNTIKKNWRGFPLVDAKTPLKLMLANDDIALGERREFEACAIHHAAERQVRAPHARILKTVAYIVHMDTEGMWKAHRYHIGTKALSVIAANDRGEVLTERQVELSPMRPSQRLTNKRQRIRKWRADTPLEKRGGKTDGRGRGGKTARKPVTNEIRNGTGKWR